MLQLLVMGWISSARHGGHLATEEAARTHVAPRVRMVHMFRSILQGSGFPLSVVNELAHVALQEKAGACASDGAD